MRGEFHDLLLQKVAESAHRATLTLAVEVGWHHATIDGAPPVFALRIEQCWVLGRVSRSKSSRSRMMGSDAEAVPVHCEIRPEPREELANV